MLLRAPVCTQICWDAGPHLRAEEVVGLCEDLAVLKCDYNLTFTFLVAWEVEDNTSFCVSSLPLESTQHIYW